MSSRTVWLGVAVMTAWCLLGAWSASAQTMATTAALRAVDPGGQERQIALIDESLVVTIDQQHASTLLRHMYHNKTGQRLEGEFSLRVGNDALVHGFAYWNGEKKIVGEVFEKAIATKIYDDTVNQQRDPGLLTMTGEGAFGFKVFPIEPDEHKRIELRFDQWLRRSGDTVEYRVPVSRSDADIRVEILDERPIGTVTSSSHNITFERSEGRVVVESQGSRGTRKELVLRYTLTDPPWTIAAAVHRDKDHDAYVLLSLPAPAATGAGIAKDVTLVIDRSGSMLGEPLVQAKAAAIDVLGRLDATDRVNVVLFDDGVEGLFSAPKPANAKNVERARAYVDKVDEGGGTDIAKALTTAFARQHDDARPKTIILLTDGKSDSKDALEAAKADTRDVRVFTVGLGDKVEKPVLSRLAANKRGTFTYVESASALRDRMSKLYGQISSAALVGLSLSVEGNGDPRLYWTYPQSLPDVFHGDEIRILSRISGEGDVKLVLKATASDGPRTIERTVTLPKDKRRSWVGRRWGRARVDHLLEEMALVGETEELRREALELGLAYNLLTPYTAFLAIPEEELTAQGRELLAAARSERDAAAAMNPDAAALGAPGARPQMDMEEHDASPSPPMSGLGRRGCAGCTLATASAPSPSMLWLLLGAAFLARRRRS